MALPILPPGGIPGMTQEEARAYTAGERSMVWAPRGGIAGPGQVLAAGPGPVPYGAPGEMTIPPVELPGQEVQGEEFPWPLLIGLGVGLIGGLLGNGNGNGNGEAPGQIITTEPQDGGAVVPYGGFGSNWQAHADFMGLGKGSPQAEGWIAANRTTQGTGVIGAEMERAWDPIQQRYYQLRGKNPYSNITLMPGRVLPGIGGFVTKTWVTHAVRKDGSLASTQMAMTSTGRMLSLSETGKMKNWRPYRSIVIGKTLTSRNLSRVTTRVKSHAKNLKKILSILK